jgi:hypothetical protein
MATGTKAYLQDKDGNNLLVGTDWSMVANKPTDIAHTSQLPVLGDWKRDGIQYVNGAYDWDHVNNGYNCAYRIADMGSFKIVELRLAFGVNQDIVNDTEVIVLPAICQADGDEEVWQSTGTRGVMLHFQNSSLHVYCQQFGSDDKYTHDGLLTFHTMYFTTL